MKAALIFLAILIEPTNAQSGETCSSETNCFWEQTEPVCGGYTSGGTGTCRGCQTTAECKTAQGPLYSDSSYTHECESSGRCNTAYTSGCSCNQACTDDYYGKIVGGSIAALFLGIAAVIASAIPCCCGYDCDNPMVPKILGGVSIFVGIFIIFIPMMASASAADGAVDDVCKECSGGCTDQEKKDAHEVLTALGFIVAYTLGFGFFACIFGPMAAAFGCGAVCQCCGPLKTKAEQSHNAPMVVSGQPVTVGAPLNIKASE